MIFYFYIIFEIFHSFFTCLSSSSVNSHNFERPLIFVSASQEDLTELSFALTILQISYLITTIITKNKKYCVYFIK